LPCLSGAEDSPTRVSTHWLLAQSEVPFQMWCRPSSRWEDRIPQKMRRQQAWHPFIEAVPGIQKWRH
jgi:hypothetical protein